jgi:hypothetical protein
VTLKRKTALFAAAKRCKTIYSIILQLFSWEMITRVKVAPKFAVIYAKKKKSNKIELQERKFTRKNSVRFLLFVNCT